MRRKLNFGEAFVSVRHRQRQRQEGGGGELLCLGAAYSG